MFTNEVARPAPTVGVEIRLHFPHAQIVLKPYPEGLGSGFGYSMEYPTVWLYHIVYRISI